VEKGLQVVVQITEHRRLRAFCRLVDAINEWTGRTVAWLFVPLTLLVMMDVFTRYVLKNPWYYLDVNIHIMGILILLGGGYAFLHGGHIGVDTIVSRFSPRNRTIIELILFPVFIGSIVALLWQTGISAWDSWKVFEKYAGGFKLPLYPYRTIVVLGVFLVLLQGTANFIRNLIFVIHPKREGTS